MSDSCSKCQGVIDEATAEIAYKFDFPIRPLLRLSEIEHILTETRVFVKPPSRQILTKLCATGVLEAKLESLGWLVFEDSFRKWVAELQKPSAAKAAA